MMNSRGMFKKIFLFVLTFLVTGVLIAADGLALQVKIKDKAIVRGEVILLGDVASFTPRTDPRVQELVALELGAAPYPGQTLSLNAKYLIFRLGANITANEDIEVKVPEILLVSREVQFVEPAQMEQIFKNHILNNAPWPAGNITFEPITTPGRLSLPAGKLVWEIREKDYDDYIGNIHLILTFLVDGKAVRTASISGRVRVRLDVIRATRNLRHGELIEGEDIKSSSEEMTYIPNRTLKDTDEIIGKRVVRPIRTGQLITAGMVEDPPLVEKGSKVLIKAESDRILITTAGRVLEEGRSGDLVRVVNISSGKEIFARVRSPELVEVNF